MLSHGGVKKDGGREEGRKWRGFVKNKIISLKKVSEILNCFLALGVLGAERKDQVIFKF